MNLLLAIPLSLRLFVMFALGAILGSLANLAIYRLAQSECHSPATRTIRYGSAFVRAPAPREACRARAGTPCLLLEPVL